MRKPPVISSLSLGGMVAQAFAYPGRRKGLILSDAAVSASLTLLDKVQCYVLFPKWLMLLTMRMLSAESVTRFSFWLARLTRNEGWIGEDAEARAYIEAEMQKLSTEEYRKI